MLTDRPSAWPRALAPLAEFDVRLIPGVFGKLASYGSLSRALLWEGERRLEAHVRRTAAFSLPSLWGVPREQSDSPDRAGALCPLDAFYVLPSE